MGGIYNRHMNLSTVNSIAITVGQTDTWLYQIAEQLGAGMGSILHFYTTSGAHHCVVYLGYKFLHPGFKAICGTLRGLEEACGSAIDTTNFWFEEDATFRSSVSKIPANLVVTYTHPGVPCARYYSSYSTLVIDPNTTTACCLHTHDDNSIMSRAHIACLLDIPLGSVTFERLKYVVPGCTPASVLPGTSWLDHMYANGTIVDGSVVQCATNTDSSLERNRHYRVDVCGGVLRVNRTSSKYLEKCTFWVVSR